MSNVFDMSVRAGEHEGLVVAVGPANAIRRIPSFADFEDFSVADLLVDLVALNDQPVADFCVHLDLQDAVGFYSMVSPRVDR